MAQLFSEIGLWRISKEGALDKGSDGILWNPMARVLALADGITDLQGDGQTDLEEFGKHLEVEREISNPLLCFRKAFYDVLQNGGQSTFVGIEIPADDNNCARILHVGDSVCSRFRDGVLEVLTPQHTAWNEMIFRYPHLLSLSQSFSSFSEPELRLFVEMIVISHEKIFGEIDFLTDESFDLSEEDHLDAFRLNLESFIQSLQSSVVADLGTSKNEVRSRVGEGILTPVQMNDIFLLHTDGMNLPVEEIQQILQSEPPVQAARTLVERSTAQDDRAVGVLRLTDVSPKTESRRIIRKSIQEDSAS